jgi:hypothetical protein
LVYGESFALLVGRHFGEIENKLSSSPKVSHQPLHGIAIIQIENRLSA